MGSKRTLLTTVGTIGAALGIGYFMQIDGTAPQRSATLKPATIDQSELRVPVAAPSESSQPKTEQVSEAPAMSIAAAISAPVNVADALPQTLPGIDLNQIQLASVSVTPVIEELTTAIMRTVAYEDIPDQDGRLNAPKDPAVPALGCNIAFHARAVDRASVALSLHAPCNPNERVTLHHIGMIFTLVTSGEGRINVTVPAMSEKAVFVADFDSGHGAVARVDVPTLGDYSRVALQWSGLGGFQIHAREFGASYGSPGHVWSGSDQPLRNTGGHVVLLGEPDTLNPNLAEIYSFPIGRSDETGTVALSIEAEVTETNCGRDIAAQSIELGAEGTIKTQDLVLTMPDCSTVGDFLVLNNLVDDLKIAAN